MGLASRPFLSGNTFIHKRFCQSSSRGLFSTLALANLFKVFAKHFVFRRYSNGVPANFIGFETWARTLYVVSVNSTLYSSVLSGLRSYFKLILGLPSSRVGSLWFADGQLSGRSVPSFTAKATSSLYPRSDTKILYNFLGNSWNSLSVHLSAYMSFTEMVFLEITSSINIKWNFAMYSFLFATLHSNKTSAGTAQCVAIFDNSCLSLKLMTANINSSCCFRCISSKIFL